MATTLIEVQELPARLDEIVKLANAGTEVAVRDSPECEEISHR